MFYWRINFFYCFFKKAGVDLNSLASMSEQQQQQAVAAAAQIINHGTPEQQQQMQNSNQLIGAAVIHSPNVVRVFCIVFPSCP
jgi:hypothetical protein